MIGILGGGLSGLALQHFLKVPSVVLEKELRAGGLCRTYEHQGFRYDFGGHILFSKNPATMRLVQDLLGADCLHGIRRNRIYYNGRLINWPFEAALGELTTEEKTEAMRGLIGCELEHAYNQGFLCENNLKEQLYENYGSWITNAFLLPYNQKLWKTVCSELAPQRRIERPSWETMLALSYGHECEVYKEQVEFLYPRGGIETLLGKLGTASFPDHTITQIERKPGAWVISADRGRFVVEDLVSTIPIPELLKLLPSVPQEIWDAANGLRYNSVTCVLIGINKPYLCDLSAVYLPGNQLVHRVCFPAYFDKSMVPTGKSSCVAEVSGLEPDPQQVVDELAATKLFARCDVEVVHCVRQKYAYPIHDVHRDKHMAVIRAYLDGLGIRLLGRFGEWDYINMDVCLQRAQAMAEGFGG